VQKRSSKKKSSKDVNAIATTIVEQATGEPITKQQDLNKNPAAVALGRLGGQKGGKARAEKLTPEQRSDIARRAAQVRWQKVADSQ